MDVIFRDFLVTLIVVSALFGVIYAYLITRHRERMAMMEKDLSQTPLTNKINSQWAALKYGLICMGIALGVICGAVLNESFGVGNKVSYISMVFLFSGLSLLLYFFLERKYRN